MYSYHPEVIWGINVILLFAAGFLGIFDILYCAVKEALASYEIGKLASIKRRLKHISQTGKHPTREAIGTVTPLELFELEQDRKFIIHKDYEDGLREYFTATGNISHIEKTAQHSRNKWHRIQALVTLGYINSPGAIKTLEHGILDKDEDIAYFSLISLGHIKTSESARVLLGYIGRHVYSSNRILSLLELFPPHIVVDEALKVIHSDNAAVRFWAVKLLARFKAKYCAPRIAPLAQDQSADVRAAACECLGKIGAHDVEVSQALLKCLGDKVWFVRMHAVRALSAVFGGQFIPEIIGLLKDQTWLVRGAVKRALVAHIEAALPHIEQFVEEDNAVLRKDYVEVLEDSGYLAVLFKQILSDDAQVKNRAIRLLTGIVHSGAHFGLESALVRFGKDSRAEILKAIASIDKQLAEHIEGKIAKHQLIEEQ